MLFREELENFFSENLQRLIPQPKESKVVDLDGLLSSRPILGSRSTLYKKISAGKIPHSKRGKKLYFDLDEIDRWLLSNKKKTIVEHQQEMDNYLNSKSR
jgi:excisionase family DNA binding protein